MTALLSAAVLLQSTPAQAFLGFGDDQRLQEEYASETVLDCCDNSLLCCFPGNAADVVFYT